jgi:hypothetical protein
MGQEHFRLLEEAAILIMTTDPQPPGIAGRVPVAQVPEPNRSLRGPYAAAMPHRFDRRDGKLHHQLSAWVPEPSPEPPTPTPPTEIELREQLAEACRRRALADENLKRSEAAHERAAYHHRACKARLAGYVNLDIDLSAAVADALRLGDDPIHARERFALRLAERAQAQVDLTVSDDAVRALLQERAIAAKAAGDLALETDKLSTRILGFAAEEIAHEIRVFEAEIARRRKALTGYDRLVAGHGDLGLALSVRDAIGALSNQDMLVANPSPWREAMNALQADPESEVMIELPELIVKAPPAPSSGIRTVITMRSKPISEPPIPPGPQDDGDPSLLDEPTSAA